MSRVRIAAGLALWLCVIEPAPAALGAAAPPGADLLAQDVRACLPLTDGGVLAGGPGGLVRLDRAGNPLGWLREPEGLPGTTVWALAPEPSEAAPDAGSSAGRRILVGTEGGLAVLRVQPEGLDVAERYPAAPVRALFGDPAGALVATWGDGLLRYDAVRHTLTPVPFVGARIPAGARRAVAVARSGADAIVATGGSGLWRLGPAGLEPWHVSLPNPYALALGESADTLLVGTLGGLVAVGKAGTRLENPADVRAALRVGERLWLATFGAGVLERHPDGRMQPLELPEEIRFVQGLGQAAGRTCFATADGLWLLDRGAPPAEARRVALAGPRSPDVSALAVQGARLWVGTFDSGLGYVEAGRFAGLAALGQDARVNALVATGAGEADPLWVATARGLALVTPAAVSWLRRADGLQHDEVHALTVLRGGGLAIGTARGAALLSGGRLVPLGAKQGLPRRAVWAIAEGPQGELWLGSTVGLYRYVAGRRAQRFSMSSGHLPDDWVTAVTLAAGRVWVGTYSRGVAALTPQACRGFAAVALGGGFVNPAGLRARGDRLFAATMDGLLSRALDLAGCWQAHPEAAPGRDVTALEWADADGPLWVASRRGLGLWAGR